jgi:hypothetical protein
LLLLLIQFALKNSRRLVFDSSVIYSSNDVEDSNFRYAELRSATGTASLVHSVHQFTLSQNEYSHYRAIITFQCIFITSICTGSYEM